MRALTFPHLTRITSCYAASATRSGVTSLILRASNATTRFSKLGGGKLGDVVTRGDVVNVWYVKDRHTGLDGRTSARQYIPIELIVIIEHLGLINVTNG